MALLHVQTSTTSLALVLPLESVHRLILLEAIDRLQDASEFTEANFWYRKP